MTQLIFLSPSTQRSNLFNIPGKRITEAAVMNGITDFIDGSLYRLSQEKNIVVIRNKTALGLRGAVTDSNTYGADIHLAIHSNAGGKGKATGTEVFYNPEKPLSKKLAQLIYNEVSIITPGGSDRGIKDGRHLYEIRKVKAPAIALIEVDFHDNRSMAEWLYSHKRIVAAALFNGLSEYLK